MYALFLSRMRDMFLNNTYTVGKEVCVGELLLSAKKITKAKH